MSFVYVNLPPQVPFELHVVQEPTTGKGGIGDIICKQAEDLQAEAVVGVLILAL